ncbi:putative AdoMet-MTase [Leptolyngbya phage Lbo-JY46]
MKYMGSKRRIAKEILPIILQDRKEGQFYVEPFVGGCNSIDKVSGPRLGNDSHYYLIKMWQALQEGWIPPDIITENDYRNIRNNKDHDPALAGYVGFSLSFGGRWFRCYRRDKKGQKDQLENMIIQSRRSKEAIMRQVPNIKDVIFTNFDYLDLNIPDESIIYCDPPYANTDTYTGNKNITGFDHALFWNWCDSLVERGHKVFVSEYTAPHGWTEVWSKNTIVNISDVVDSKKYVTEKLFTK